METKRKFNKEAYDTMDMPCRLALKSMMSKKGYTLVGDINKEEFKKYDLKFEKDGEFLTFENEMRKPFNSIRDYYDTIHIPIRKANNQSDWYIVWNIGCTECAMIKTSKIRSFSKTDVVNVHCNEGTHFNYKEDFIDVPKNEWTFYRLVKGSWKKK